MGGCFLLTTINFECIHCFFMLVFLCIVVKYSHKTSESRSKGYVFTYLLTYLLSFFLSFFHFTSFHFISFHFVSFPFLSFRSFIPFHFTSRHFVHLINFSHNIHVSHVIHFIHVLSFVHLINLIHSIHFVRFIHFVFSLFSFISFHFIPCHPVAAFHRLILSLIPVVLHWFFLSLIHSFIHSFFPLPSSLDLSFICAFIQSFCTLLTISVGHPSCPLHFCKTSTLAQPGTSWYSP